jgi:hypothetical protein
MKHGKLLLIAVVFALFIVPSGAFAQTVELSATLSGTRACGDMNIVKLKLPQFVRFDGSFFDVFLDSNFSNLYVSLEIFAAYEITSTTFAVGAISTTSPAALFEGTVKVTAKSFSFTGVYNDADDPCFSYGTIKSGKIIAVF